MSDVVVYVLNGPNLNLLGEREPEIYGYETLADIEAKTRAEGAKHSFKLEFRQSNNEGDLVDWVQEAAKSGAGLIINPGAYTHTSVALLDALSAIAIPKIELHLSNIHAREEFRRKSITAAGVDAALMGFGSLGYLMAIGAMANLIADKKVD